MLLPALILVLVPASAFAQGGSGDMAVSGNFGIGNAIDDDFEGIEPFLNGTFEYYTSKELSWRGMLGFVSFDAEDVDAEIEYTIFAANVVYYFTGDGVVPFVTGGLGLYDTELDGGPGFDDSELEVAANVGGGIDIPIQDNFAIKIEGLFHIVAGDGPDTLFTATGGLKWTF
ncbi:MAG: outer membrane beta-barrel protein [Candidatus Polarisedimenticolia bacterium]